MINFPMSFNVAGVTFEGRQKYIHELNKKSQSGKQIKIDLVPEPDNKYDSNAIKVLADGIPIGYVPRTLNSFLIPTLDSLSVTEMIIAPLEAQNILYVSLTINKKEE